MISKAIVVSCGNNTMTNIDFKDLFDNNLPSNLQHEIKDVRSLVKGHIQGMTNESEWLSKYALYIFGAQNTKLLPALSLAISAAEQTYNNRIERKNRIASAAIVELLQRSYLIHKDCATKRNIRLNKICLHKILGDKIAMGISNILWLATIQIANLTYNNKLITSLLKTFENIFKGEITKNRHITYTSNLSENHIYKKIIQDENLSMFNFIAESAFYISHNNHSGKEGILELYKNFSSNFGAAFHLVCDANKYSDKNKISHDFINGKVGLLFFIAMEIVPNLYKKDLWLIFNDKSLKRELAWFKFYAILDKFNILNVCIKKAKQHLKASKENVEELTNSFHRPKQHMDNLLLFCEDLDKYIQMINLN